MIRNPDSDSPPTIFTAPPDDFDDSKFVPVPIKKGDYMLLAGIIKIEPLLCAFMLQGYLSL